MNNLPIPTKIYLDDVRTPNDESSWIVVRNYEEFVAKITEIGLEKIHTISLDHDLGEDAMSEYFNNVSPNYKLDYSNIQEKTGMDCAKWLVDYFYNNYAVPEPVFSWRPSEVPSSDDRSKSRAFKKKHGITFPIVYTHSANPIGSANIMGYINNFLMNEGQGQTCVRVSIPHSVKTIKD